MITACTSPCAHFCGPLVGRRPARRARCCCPPRNARPRSAAPGSRFRWCRSRRLRVGDRQDPAADRARRGRLVLDGRGGWVAGRGCVLGHRLSARDRHTRGPGSPRDAARPREAAPTQPGLDLEDVAGVRRYHGVRSGGARASPCAPAGAWPSPAASGCRFPPIRSTSRLPGSATTLSSVWARSWRGAVRIFWPCDVTGVVVRDRHRHGS